MVDILVGSFFVHTKGSLEAWEDSHSAKRGALFPVVKHVNSSDQQHYSLPTNIRFNGPRHFKETVQVVKNTKRNDRSYLLDLRFKFKDCLAFPTQELKKKSSELLL